jgi:hypothetical protein
MDPVKFVLAAAGMAPTGTGSYSYFAYADIVVENLAYDKIVGLWAHQPLGNLWTLHPGTFRRSVPANREIWHVQVGGTPIDRFAVQYEAAGSVFWDNNFGHDYFTDAQAAQQEDGIGTALIASPVQVASSFNSGGSLEVSILVQNLAYVKQVGIRYTTSNWWTFNEAFGTYVRSYPPPSTPAQISAEYWRAAIPLGPTLHGQFAAFYRVQNATYWDNDFSLNYRF